MSAAWASLLGRPLPPSVIGCPDPTLNGQSSDSRESLLNGLELTLTTRERVRYSPAKISSPT